MNMNTIHENVIMKPFVLYGSFKDAVKKINKQTKAFSQGNQLSNWVGVVWWTESMRSVTLSVEER